MRAGGGEVGGGRGGRRKGIELTHSSSSAGEIGGGKGVRRKGMGLTHSSSSASGGVECVSCCGAIGGNGCLKMCCE